jgi:hypothetical protein
MKIAIVVSFIVASCAFALPIGDALQVEDADVDNVNGVDVVGALPSRVC